MWILITKFIPCAPPFPIKLGIYWSIPWIYDFKRKKGKEQEDEVEISSDFRVTEIGLEPDGSRARGINIGDSRIRVFPHEFRELSADSMSTYVFGIGNEPASHTLVPDNTAQEKLLSGVLDGDSRPLYDAALLEGCTKEQALHVALGGFLDTDVEFPPIGWYRPAWALLEAFCRDYELQAIEETYGKW